MLCNSFKYVNYSDLKKFSSDFKTVYNAPNEKAGLDAKAGCGQSPQKSSLE